MGIDPTLRSAVSNLDILVVEDDPEVQEGLSVLLERCGASVTCASSAAEALDLVSGGVSYDVMISDLEMPEHDGLWLMNELKRKGRQEAAPAHWAILLTGSARDAIEETAADAGFDLCLRKPISANSLLGAIARREGIQPR
ncbi:MAG: response regulator [Vicinamibacteria bacterium]